MGDAHLTGATCSSCGYVYADAAALATMLPEERSPCPTCGSTAVTLDLFDGDTATVHEMAAVKGRQHGLKRPAIEIKDGDDLHRDSGRWMKIRRVVDRQREPAWYTEQIVDAETGEVVREVDEPLSDHQGRGSARKPKT